MIYFNLFISWMIFLVTHSKLEKKKQERNELREKLPHIKKLLGEREENNIIGNLVVFLIIWFFISAITTLSLYFWNLIF